MKVWDEQVRTEARSQRDELVKTGVSGNHLACILKKVLKPHLSDFDLFVCLSGQPKHDYFRSFIISTPSRKAVFLMLLCTCHLFPSTALRVLLWLLTPHLRFAWPAEGKLVGGDEPAKMGGGRGSGREDELCVSWSQVSIAKSHPNHREFGESVL